jgi:formamidopyrimidine-DNA glycosylase
MPELPEVETVMRGLRARLEGRRIVRAATHRADMRWPFPPGLTAALTGARVLGFRRRAKYILMRISGGNSLLIHLGMSGRMVLDHQVRGGPTRGVGKHEHFVIEADDGWHVGFVDPRRFGSVDLVPTGEEDAHRLLKDLGPEPLEAGFNARVLGAALAGRQTPIKAALLDQGTVAGLGNIYVCEALFRARISPERLAGEISGARVRVLAGAIKAVLTEAIAAGGSSLRDYVQPDGELGYFQHAWKVYGREGEPCERCPRRKTTARAATCPLILRITQSGRSTFWCRRTQR